MEDLGDMVDGRDAAGIWNSGRGTTITTSCDAQSMEVTMRARRQRSDLHVVPGGKV